VPAASSTSLCGCHPLLLTAVTAAAEAAATATAADEQNFSAYSTEGAVE